MNVAHVLAEAVLNGPLAGAESLAVPLLPVLIVVLAWAIWARRFRR